MEFWAKQFPKHGEISMAELAEFIINNMIWNPATEDLDRVKMAFFFGDTIAMAEVKEKEATEGSPPDSERKDLQEEYG